MSSQVSGNQPYIPSVTKPNEGYLLGKNVKLDSNTLTCIKGTKKDCAAQKGADKVKTVMATTATFTLIGTCICPGPGSAAGAIVGLSIGTCVIL